MNFPHPSPFQGDGKGELKLLDEIWDAYEIENISF